MISAQNLNSVTKNLSYSSECLNPLVQAKLKAVDTKIKELVEQKDYPCIGALRAIKKGDYRIGVYKDFGRGSSARLLRDDLLLFLAEQKRTNSPYLSFIASFPEDFILSEQDFENRMWAELSHVSSRDSSAWDPLFSEKAEDKNFCFSLGGSAFFVVGLHAKSSRTSRTFAYPTLIFNLYEQFEILDRAGQYESMVDINRKKSIAFEGSVNPMIEKYAETWEAIQFSGRQNSENWKCPFHREFKNSPENDDA